MSISVFLIYQIFDHIYPYSSLFELKNKITQLNKKSTDMLSEISFFLILMDPHLFVSNVEIYICVLIVHSITIAKSKFRIFSLQYDE